MLVAIALIEGGMNALAAVEFIREKRRQVTLFHLLSSPPLSSHSILLHSSIGSLLIRVSRGSINMRQIQYLKAYKVRSKKGKNCIIM